MTSDRGSTFKIDMWFTFDDGASTTATSSIYSWGAEIDSKCYSADGSTYVSLIDYNSQTLNDVTIMILGSADTQTVVFDNSVSGTQGDTASCGATRTVLGSASQPWLTIDGVNNSITCQSTDANEVTGTFTVEIAQVLVDYESFWSESV